MIRWIRNILVAALIAILVIAALFLNAAGLDPTDLLPALFLAGLFLIIFLWILWALGVTRFSSAWIRQRSTVILSYVEQAVRLNLPLPRLLRAAEASEPRWIAGSIADFRAQLEQGSSITEALRNAAPGTGYRTLALLGAAERIGQLGPELSRIVRERQQPHGSNIADRSFLRAYPVAMIVAITCVLFLVMVFVMPKFAQIFHDFRSPLPPLTRAVIDFTDYPNGIIWLTLAVVFSVLLSIAQHLRHRMGWFDSARWFASSRDLADICHVIANELEAGQPMNSAIRAAGDLSIGRALRRKLAQWAGEIERGLPMKGAAINAGVPALIAGLTTSAEGFAFLSRYYEAKFSRLKILLRAAAIPAMVMVFGFIVAVVALALFLPLVALISSVSPGSGPYASWL